MSRNLATSSCCDNIVRLSDLRGKPIEFRRYHQYAPNIGTRWDCPTCGTAYFAIWRETENSRSIIVNPGNAMCSYERASTFTIDLSYYESYNDEHSGIYEKGKPYISWEQMTEEQRQAMLANPGGLCVDDAEEAQWVWG